MKKRISSLSVLVLTLALFLGGCKGGSKFSAADAMVGVAETAAGAGDYDLGFNGSAEMPMAPAAAPQEEFAQMEEDGAADNLAVETSSSQPLPLTRKLIRNMDLQVETTDFDPLITALQTKVGEFNGYIEQSDISGESITNQGRPSKRYAHMTLRIPAEKLDSFIVQVEAVGNIIYKSESVSDVTLQYSDIESRLKTLRMEQERLWELLAKADTTEAIILLEERLTEVSSEIESSESRMRYLNNSVTYSTVNLSIDEVDIESPTQPETAWQQIQRGFTRNLISLMDNLTRFFISLLSNLPVILFLALLVFIIVTIVRRINRRKTEKTPKPPKPFPISSMHFSGNSQEISPTDTESADSPTPDSHAPVHPSADTSNKEDEA